MIVRQAAHPHADLRSPWFPFVRPAVEGAVQLLCFAHAGGSASTFRRWREQLGPRVQVWACQLPGHETRLREPPLTELRTLVSEVVRAVAPTLRPPFALFGHSLGSVVAFEVARQLRRLGLPGPSHLMLSAHDAPHLPPVLSPISAATDEALLARLDYLGGMPREVRQTPALLREFLPVIRADFALLERYRFDPEAPLSCPATLFSGSDDPGFPPDRVELWRAHLSDMGAPAIFDGGHFFLRTHEDELLARVASLLVPNQDSQADA